MVWVGIDVGATRLKAGRVGADDAVTDERVAWLGSEDRSEAGILARLTELVRAVDPRGDAVGVGLGVAGVIDRARGVITTSPNFPEWKNFSLADHLGAAVGARVLLDNDANCVVAGEALAGAARGVTNLIGLTLGTGVGGGLILDGRLWRGQRGMAGELGHVTVDPAGPPCNCGGRGCLEMYPSLVGLREPPTDVDPDDPDLPRALAAAAERGNPTAQQHFDAAGRGLGIGLAGFLNVLDVSTILLAGGIAAAWPLLRPSAEREIAQRTFPAIREGLDVRIATLGERAGIIGAALQERLG